MNENPNNRSGIPQKQINRVVAPIQVDANGNKVETQAAVQPKIVNTSIREVVNPNGTPNLPPEKPKREHDQTNTVFAVVLLIILACVCGFIFYIIVPRQMETENRLRYNDGTTTKYADNGDIENYNFKSIRINEGIKVTTTGNFVVDNDFQIATVANGNMMSVSINGKNVATVKAIIPTVGRVDDLILMLFNDGNARQNRVVAFDKTGNNVLDLRNIEGVDGMIPLGDASSFIVNSNSFVVLASRAVGNNLVLSNTYGEITGISVCDTENLSASGISDEYMVVGSFSIGYKGNHEFSTPTNITSIKLGDYKSSNRYCG
ncbi:MAG: hypothetical protein K2I70_03640 [Bacilli bacterium]|nr:hypothetical protein [Bacilli bacterium]